MDLKRTQLFLPKLKNALERRRSKTVTKFIWAWEHGFGRSLGLDGRGLKDSPNYTSFLLSAYMRLWHQHSIITNLSRQVIVDTSYVKIV
jgi:hypothetical protein